ncbi:hypothetical protein [Kutzneria buriramensis]|uniref:Uncharacterized protein n=1 Tax=Kutzneria buriramensis TaxID=1045776 RepID=A0A3E0HUK2_9PSEU|nr:hypothetical protein [Kutzneria buriramensis]REH50081.1 hypothetical protein BCF44_104351 [Kutzneria buriramensis]
MKERRAAHLFALLVLVVTVGPVVSIWLSVIAAAALFLPQVPTSFTGGGLRSIGLLVAASLAVSQVLVPVLRLVPGRPYPRIGAALCALIGLFAGVLVAILA